MGLLDRKTDKPEYEAVNFFGGWVIRKHDGYNYSFLFRNGDTMTWLSDTSIADRMSYETAHELLDKLKGE